MANSLNSLTAFVDYAPPDPNKKKNENNNDYLSGALNRATTNKTSSGQNTQSGNDLLSALTSKFNSTTNNNASSGQNTAAGSNWSNNLTAMANTVSKGYPSTGNTARANLSANSGTSASQTQGKMLSPYEAQRQGIQNPQSSTRASLADAMYKRGIDENGDPYVTYGGFKVITPEELKKQQEKEKELAEEKERIEQILKEKGLLDSGNIRWMGNEPTPTGQTIVDPSSMNNGNMPTATTPTTSDIPTPTQPGFGTGTSIPYGQRNYSVFSGSNADANGNNGSLVKMGADGRTVNIDQSYATKELPSYTMSEAQYGTYDTSMAKGDEFQKYIGDKGNWSDGLLETVKAIDDYDTLHTDSKKAIDSSYATAQKLNEYKDRNVKEGYSAEDLAVMSQSGLDSLNNAYKRALNSAAADYNRLGLRGSGFELGNSYGNTTDSITGQYLSNVAKLQNEIDAKGLEAAREDRFRNAEANDKNRTDVIKTALDIGNSMNDTDNKRIENIQNIQEKNRNAYSEALKTINNLFTSSDQSQRGWASQNESEHKNDYDAILKAVELGKQSQATQYSTAATILNGLLNAIGTASSGGNRDALNGAIERINQVTNPKDSNSSSYLNEILKALGIPVVNNA